MSNPNLRKFGPKESGDRSTGRPCPACDENFEVGDFTTLIPLGPGSGREAQKRCREGRPYNAVAKEVHWACATGEVEDVEG